MKKLAIVPVALAAVLLCDGILHGQTAAADPHLNWAKGIVWYQIFPERFRNGSTANDPVPAEVSGTEREPGWQTHPWTSDWYELQPWEAKRSTNFYSMVNTRRYGGDLLGVIQKLDYLKDLGVGAIYFNPVFEADSLHKYDGANYHHIDDNFGPDAAGDKASIAAAHETDDPKTWIWTSADKTFLTLLKEAHRRNIRVLMDGVFNHTGRNNFVFQDIVKNGRQSRYASWYDVLAWDDPGTPQNEFSYASWSRGRNGSLPEWAEDANGLVAGPRQYVFACTRRWMDPNGDGNPADGIDGWRLDVIKDVKPAFWEEWYKLVKSINPAAVTVGEIWEDASDWIGARRIDSTMHYVFARAVVNFFIDRKLAITGTEFDVRLQKTIQGYGMNTFQMLWNLMDSHDTDRLASMIVNPDRGYQKLSKLRDNPNYDVRKPNEAERQVQMQIVAFQMTLPGAPVIYNGDEAGMWGADDPDDRKPMVWQDLKYAVEKSHPLAGRSRPADSNDFDASLFAAYKKLIAIHNGSAALRSGDYQNLAEVTGQDSIGFLRTTGRQQAIAVFNRSGQPMSASIPSTRLKGREFENALTGARVPVKNGKLAVEVGPKGYLILLSR